MSQQTSHRTLQFVNNPDAPVVFVDGINGVFSNENGIVRLVFYQANAMHGEIAETPRQTDQNVIAVTLVMHSETLDRVVNVLNAAREEMRPDEK